MAFNIALLDAVLAAIEQERGDQITMLLQCSNESEGGYRYRIGEIEGLRLAIEIAEETRRKLMGE